MPRFRDITGEIFGALIALEPTDKSNKAGNKIWKCLCSPALGGCGSFHFVNTSALRNGSTISCGCIGREIQRKRLTTHGDYGSNLYRRYRSMVQRCCDSNSKDFKHYGGRGIKVCDEWRKSYAAFKSWAVTSGYDKKLQLDRYPDKDGNYSPENCRWVSAVVNNRNKRNNKLITIEGEERTLTEWLEIYDISDGAYRKRIKKGMTEVEALTKPVDPRYVTNKKGSKKEVQK